MTTEEIVGFVIVSVIALPLIAISIVLMTGRGSDFIAGVNTLSREEKEKYDLPAMCKLVGRVTLPMGLLMPTVVLGGAFAAVFTVYMVCGAVFVLIRLKSKRFRR